PKTPGGAAPAAQPRRNPGSSPPKSGKNIPKAAEKIEKAKTDEEWYEDRSTADRKQWLTANFAETGGYFEVVRAEQTNCKSCEGTGFTKSSTTGGEEEQHFCVICNGCGVVRTVSYR